MKWLLLMVIAEVNGEITVHVLSDHDTMAGCHVAGTRTLWEERQANRELLCFPTDIDIEVME
jgi:hypothetical protein